GDTLWGKQLDPLVANGTINAARRRLIMEAYQGADVVVADAGGGPIHPDPREVDDLSHRSAHQLLVTHVPADPALQLRNAPSGAAVTLQPAPRGDPAPDADDLLALATSPVLNGTPERWRLGMLNGGEVLPVESVQELPVEGCLFLLRGRARLQQPG